MRTGRGDASRISIMERVIIQTGKYPEDVMCVSGERIPTETDPNFYPFEHAVTLRLCPRDAARLGEETITVSEAAILQNCELPKATELPAVETHTPKLPTKQLTLLGNEDTEEQATLF